MDLAYELHDLVRTLDRDAESLLRPAGLNYHRYVTLLIVTEHPGVTGRQLAEAIGVSQPAMSGIVRRLIADRLIENQATAGAGHVRHLAVTDRGTRTVRDASTLLGDAVDRHARAIGVDPSQLAETIHALHDQVRTPQPRKTL